MDGDAAPHAPVMPEAVLRWLAVRPDGVYVDGTAGAGGHAALIAARLGTGALIALDRDPSAVALARERLAPYPRAVVMRRNYAALAEALAERGFDRADGVLIDAGVSSMQLDQAERGFSFQSDAPLDMRMDPSSGPSAAQWLAETPEHEIAATLRALGDVKPAKRIAASIARRRGRGGLERTGDLAAAVREALPFVQGEPDEVRTVFQAVRMAVNDELGSLRAGLEQAIAALKPGGRLVTIAFHSGEDRVVKQLLRDASRPTRELRPDGRVARTLPARCRLLTPRPERPGPEEIARNRRAQSARLRAAERLNTGD